MEEKTLDNSIEYAKMIEVPVCTCEYSFKRKKPFFKKKLLKAVNARLAKKEVDTIEEQTENNEHQNATADLNYTAEQEGLQEAKNSEESTLPVIYDKVKAKREKRFNAVISAQVVAVFALISAIILTNLFWENSAMNTLFKSVFQSEHGATTELEYDDFTLTLPIADVSGISIEAGAIAISGEYSLYPVCDGKVSKVDRAENGTFTVTLEHSESFSSVIEGLDMVYFAAGEEVTRHMPVGYVKNNAKVYLYNGESLLTDYATVENSIIFNK
jgi:hypothetical protein